jgi:ankyrin repeat protein
METAFPALETALLAAVARCQLQRIDLLIKTGVDVNQRSGLRGFTPLHKAAEKGHCEMLQDLLDAGADQTLLDSVRIPFFPRLKSFLIPFSLFTIFRLGRQQKILQRAKNTLLQFGYFCRQREAPKNTCRSKSQRRGAACWGNSHQHQRLRRKQCLLPLPPQLLTSQQAMTMTMKRR